jgi:hypothetical protein
VCDFCTCLQARQVSLHLRLLLVPLLDLLL